MRRGLGEGVGFSQGARDGVLRGQALFGARALKNFLSQLFVGDCQLSGPFNDLLLKLLRGPILVRYASSFLQPNRRLVRRYSQEEFFDLRREISSPGASH